MNGRSGLGVKPPLQGETSLQRLAFLQEGVPHGDKVKRIVIGICQVFTPKLKGEALAGH